VAAKGEQLGKKKRSLPREELVGMALEICRGGLLLSQGTDLSPSTREYLW